LFLSEGVSRSNVIAIVLVITYNVIVIDYEQLATFVL